MSKRKEITLKNEDYQECPECEGELNYQEEWDKAFDRYDTNTPAFDLVIKKIYKNGIPKYICKNCGVNILVI